eukprot:6492635-Amphidinium_carterae.2
MHLRDCIVRANFVGSGHLALAGLCSEFAALAAVHKRLVKTSCLLFRLKVAYLFSVKVLFMKGSCVPDCRITKCLCDLYPSLHVVCFSEVNHDGMVSVNWWSGRHRKFDLSAPKITLEKLKKNLMIAFSVKMEIERCLCLLQQNIFSIVCLERVGGLSMTDRHHGSKIDTSKYGHKLETYHRFMVRATCACRTRFLFPAIASFPVNTSGI